MRQLFDSDWGYDVSEDNCWLVIKQYDHDGDERWNYKEFLEATLPATNPEVRTRAVKRENYEVRPGQTLPEDVEDLLSALLIIEVDISKQIEKRRTSLNLRRDFSPISTFRTIDCKNTGYIDFLNLAVYLRKRGGGAHQADVAAIIRRLDHDLDCRVCLAEFRDALQGTTSVRSPETAKTARRGCVTAYQTPIKQTCREFTSPTKKTERSRPEVTPQTCTSSPLRKSGRPSPLRSVLSLTPLKQSRPEAVAEREVVHVLLEKQMKSELELEGLRRTLALKKDATIDGIVSAICQEGRVLSPLQFLDAVASLAVHMGSTDAYRVFRKLDRDSDGRVTPGDVGEAVLPRQKEYRELLQTRTRSRHLGEEAVGALGQLIRRMAEVEGENERLKAELGLDVLKASAFKELDTAGAGYFTREDVSRIR